ncbi:MAG: hypothetical protein H6706_07390 [Myxococcales bacterium]|nr:hypothetical protein [Myxococcales bacterium]
MSARWLAVLAALAAGCGVVLEADPTVDAGPTPPDATAADAAADAGPPPDAMICDPVPPLVRFEDVAVGDLAAAAIPLGCGGGLRVQQATLLDVSPPDAFHLPDALPAGPVDLLRLTYRPRLVAERARAVLVLATDAGDFTIPVAGNSRWSDAACRHWDVEIIGTGIDGVIRLDATPPPGVAPTAAQVLWAVAERPEGSVSALTEDFQSILQGDEVPDDPATPGAWFFLDVGGLYTFDCTVKPPAGADCPPQNSRLRVQACPCPDDVRVRLTWSVAAGGEAPADLDLHLLHPSAAAFGAPGLDCSPADLDPRWIAGTTALERPAHSGDDATAPGFERVQLPRAEGVDTLAGPYRVAVENRSAVPVMATAQIFVTERLVWTGTRALGPADRWWDVAAVGWHRGELVAAAFDRPVADADLDPWAPLPASSACLPDQPPACAEGFTCRDDDGALVGRCRR